MKKVMLFFVMLLSMSFVYANEVSEGGDGWEYVYDMHDYGYVTTPIQTSIGVIATNSRASEIYLIENGKATTLVQSPGCGLYLNLNFDKTKVGFKSIDLSGYQAPAILDLQTKEITMLDDYSEQCGQVSFAEDGTIVYTNIHDLVIIKDGRKHIYDLGYYVNIANISPKGDKIAFADRDGHPMLFDVNLGKASMLSDMGDMYINKWSPSGKCIYFQNTHDDVWVFDLVSKQKYYIGRVFGAQWANDETLVFSKSHYLNNDYFYYNGTSVEMSDYQGMHGKIIVPASFECPQEIGIIGNSQLAIPYGYGDNRRIAVVDVDNPTKENVIFKIPAGQQFGKVINLADYPFVERPNARKIPAQNAETQANAKVGAYDIPYIQQSWDVPTSHAGCYNYGGAACAPCTSVMLLAHYGLVDKWTPYYSRAEGSCTWGTSSTGEYSATYLQNGAQYHVNGVWGRYNPYCGYVGLQYTNKFGYTFSLVANKNGCDCKGACGWQWNNGSPASRMGNFYKNSGISDAGYKSNGGSLSDLRDENDNGYPLSWCITSSRTQGHLILPFRVDLVCDKGSDTYGDGQVCTFSVKNGSMIVNDPAGNANNSTWRSDGRHATYQVSGYNNGYLTMYAAWACYTHFTKQVVNVDVTGVSLNVSSTSVNKNKTVTLSATVSPSNATNKSLTWTSSNTSVATVSNGVVTPVAEGTTTITVKTVDGNFTATCTVTVTAAAKTTLAGKKIYINPGHGGWNELNDRHIPTIPFPRYMANGKIDTLGFWESSSNLKVGFVLDSLLTEYGATVKMSRYDNRSGKYDARDGGTTTWDGSRVAPTDPKIGDREFADIKDEAQAWGANCMISIHSNASDKEYINCLHHYIRAKSGSGENWTWGGTPYNADHLRFSKTIYKYMHDDPCQNWNQSLDVDHEYYTFTTSLGMLSSSSNMGYSGFTNGPTLLCEASFHSYMPQTHRFLNIDCQRLEAYRFFYGVLEYYGADLPETAVLCGDVRSATEIMTNSTYRGNVSESEFNSKFGKDRYKPINGCQVQLLKNGSVVKIYNCDNYYNGLFAFYDLVPGAYQLKFVASGYNTKVVNVNVATGKMNGANVQLTIGQGEDPISVTPTDTTSTGACNPYSWKSASDMYAALAHDVYEAKNTGKCPGFIFMEGFEGVFGPATITHDESGPSFDIQSFDMSFFTTAPYGAKWGWLKTYLDARCDAAGVANSNDEESASAIIRYNLSAFFANSVSSEWPQTGDFTSYGAASTKYENTWGYSFHCEAPVDTTSTDSVPPTPPTPVDTTEYDCNEYGWQTGNDMYQAFAADVIAAKNAGLNFVFADGFGTDHFEFGTPSASEEIGLAFDIQEFDIAFFTTEPYASKWGWLYNFLNYRTADAMLATMSTTAEDGGNSVWRWNLAAFFANEQRTAWPATPDYSIYGVNSKQYNELWGQQLCGGTGTSIEQVNIIKHSDVIKIFVDGQLYIIRDNVRYNALGQVVK